MKKTIFNFLFLLLAFASLASCSDDMAITVKSPKIRVSLLTEVPPTVYPSETIPLEFKLEYEKGISKVWASADGTVLDETVREFEEALSEVTVSFEYLVQDIYAGNTIDFAVAATAVDGAEGHYDVPVFVMAAKSDISVSLPEDAPSEFLVDGSVLAMDVQISSANVDLKKLTVYKNGNPVGAMSVDFGENVRAHTLNFSYQPTMGDTGAPTLFTFEIQDVNGNITEAYYSIQFYKAASTELNEYNGVIMGMNKCITHGQFFNAHDNVVYKAPGVGAECANVDFVTFWSNNTGTKGAAFASPNAFNVSSIYTEATIVNLLGGSTEDIPLNWTPRNETIFRILNIDADAFASVSTKAEVEELFQNGTSPANEHVVMQVKAGTTLAFCTLRKPAKEDGQESEPEPEPRYGLIRVTERAATNNTGTITFDYKIVK